MKPRLVSINGIKFFRNAAIANRRRRNRYSAHLILILLIFFIAILGTIYNPFSLLAIECIIFSGFMVGLKMIVGDLAANVLRKDMAGSQLITDASCYRIRQHTCYILLTVNATSE